MTAKLSVFVIDRAIKEANKYEYFDLLVKLKNLKDIFSDLGLNLNFNREERLIRKHEFVDKINEQQNYDEFVTELNFIGDDIRDRQKQSYIGSIGGFLEAWLGQDNGFSRILTKDFSNGNLVLSYRCLDPSLITKDVIDRSFATILMSGTLTPTNMYNDILGFSDTKEKVYGNPFPKDNRLCLIVPETTTKFTRRNDAEYKKMAEICNKIVNKVPGNVALFFPSYNLRDKVYKHFYEICKKKKFVEKPNLSKEEKESILDKFKKSKK